MAEAGDLKVNVETPDFAEVFRPMRLMGIGIEVLEEIKRARDKHGSNAALPDGTGKLASVLNDLHHTPGRSGSLYTKDNEDLEALAKARTDLAHDEGTKTREMILTEEWAEAVAEEDPAALRAELIQVAAMAMDWVADIDVRPTEVVTYDGFGASIVEVRE